VQFHCCVSVGDRVLRQRMEVELGQAVHDAVDGQRTAPFVLLFDGVSVIRKSQRRLMEPELQWSEVPIENDVVDVNRRLSLRTSRARAGLPAWRLSPKSWFVVTGVSELRRAGIGARRKDRSATRFPQRQ
jgi:hypothetical protein